MITPFQYVYGPVYSWRLGRSLGVDPLSSTQKICNMDCIYCQLGKTAQLTNERKVFVPADEIVDEIRRIPLHFVDHITFSGRGEPTLAKNLGEMIRKIKGLRHEKVAVITNSSLMSLPEVRADLMPADFVLAKLDAASQLSFETVDKGQTLDLAGVIQGIVDFRSAFKGKLALQVMLVNENIESVEQIAQVARQVAPDEVQLNTPLRPSGARPVERQRLQWAKGFFKDMPVVSVYDAPSQEYTPMDERATMKRHGNYYKTQFKPSDVEGIGPFFRKTRSYI